VELVPVVVPVMLEVLAAVTVAVSAVSVVPEVLVPVVSGFSVRGADRIIDLRS
jgi:hypothetical protein